MSARTITVLIAEPLNIVRAGLRALLQGEEGLAVVGEAADGVDLVKMVAQLKPDVLLLEPGLSGSPRGRLLVEATGAHPPLKVLVLAGPEHVPSAMALLEAGAGGCILKSDRPEELVRGIRATAAGETAISSAVARGLLEQQRPLHLPASDTLTDREREILELLTAGLPNKGIAQKLYLSVRTVEVHLGNIYSKLGVRSRLEAVSRTVLHDTPGQVRRGAHHVYNEHGQ